MIKRATCILILLFVLLSLTSCGLAKEERRYSVEFFGVFDTITQIVGYSDNEAEFKKQANYIRDELEIYHQLYDIYNDYEGINNIKTINDNAGKMPVQVDEKIIDLLRFSKDTYVRTKGKTDVAFGSVLKVWHDYREAGIADPEKAELPPPEKLQKAAEHVNLDDLVIDETQSTVFIKDPAMRLDVGAVAKGYATERISKAAEAKGFKSGVISVGGNVRAIGKKGNTSELWNVGIQNPNKERGTENLYVLNLTNKSLVTSGDYERYYRVNGKKYNHIIDPETLYPATDFVSVTVITEDGGLADALSTALFILPYEEGRSLIKNFSDVEVLWVYPDGSQKYSDGFMSLVKKAVK